VVRANEEKAALVTVSHLGNFIVVNVLPDGPRDALADDRLEPAIAIRINEVDHGLAGNAGGFIIIFNIEILLRAVLHPAFVDEMLDHYALPFIDTDGTQTRAPHGLVAWNPPVYEVLVVVIKLANNIGDLGIAGDLDVNEGLEVVCGEAEVSCLLLNLLLGPAMKAVVSIAVVRDQGEGFRVRVLQKKGPCVEEGVALVPKTMTNGGLPADGKVDLVLVTLVYAGPEEDVGVVALSGGAVEGGVNTDDGHGFLGERRRRRRKVVKEKKEKKRKKGKGINNANFLISQHKNTTNKQTKHIHQSESISNKPQNSRIRAGLNYVNDFFLC
jgi:hypothetical protein